MAVRFYNEDCGFLPKGRMKIAEWVRQTVAAEGYRAGEIAYIFCSSDYHIGINRQYLGHDYNTDVITFDYSDLTDRKIVSGDIFIDPYTVEGYAVEWETEFREELMRVIIHGVLHLCGYFDKTETEKHQMRSKEDFYLCRYNESFGEFVEQPLKI